MVVINVTEIPDGSFCRHQNERMMHPLNEPSTENQSFSKGIVAVEGNGKCPNEACSNSSRNTISRINPSTPPHLPASTLFRPPTVLPKQDG
jgi:hypothetical protein